MDLPHSKVAGLPTTRASSLDALSPRQLSTISPDTCNYSSCFVASGCLQCVEPGRTPARAGCIRPSND